MANWYVDDIDGLDAAPGDGSQAHPYKTVGKAVSVAATTDTIWLADGTYDDEVGLISTLATLTIRGTSGDWTKVIIKPATSVQSWNSSWGTWLGFTATGCNITLQDLTIIYDKDFIAGEKTYNTVIATSTNTGNLVYIRNCFIRAINWTNIVFATYNLGGGTKGYKSTIRGFGVTYGGSNSSAFRTDNGTITAYDCIFEGNRVALYGNTITENYNCFYNNTTNRSNGNLGANDIITNPLFDSATVATWPTNSPCKNAGVVVSGYVETYSGANPDMGCYEFNEVVTNSQTITSIIKFFKVATSSITSNILFKKINNQSINSLIKFYKTATESITSNIKFITLRGSESINSNVLFKKTNNQTITSNIYFYGSTNSESIISLITFYKTVVSSINSNIKFYKAGVQEVLNSNITFYKIGIQELINSNIKFYKSNVQESITSNIQFYKVANASITSNIRFGSLYESKFIHDDSLYIITDTTPATLIKVNIDEAIPTSETYTLSESKAKAIAINFTTHQGYIACDNGNIVKFDLLDPSIRTTFPTGDTIQLNSISIKEDFNFTYVGDTEEDSLYLLDESEASIINTKLAFLKETSYKIQTLLAFVFKKIINTKLAFLQKYVYFVNTKLCFNKLANLSPSTFDNIILDDFSVYLDVGGTDVLLSDVQLPSIKVTYQDSGDETAFTATATFNLIRKHDDPNHTLAGVDSPITSKNRIKIYIRSRLVFDGYINDIDMDSKSELISLSCLGYAAKNANIIELPLVTLNSQLHWYDVIVNNIKINKPIVKTIVPTNEQASDEDCRGIMVDLGTQIEEQVALWSSFNPGTYEIDKLNNGTFEFVPNFTYFWWVSIEKFGLPGDFGYGWMPNGVWGSYYVGTSLQPVANSLFKFVNAGYKRQSVRENKETELGYYYVGSAPYKEVSCANGRYIAKAKLEEKEDGLYWVIAEHYDNVAFAKAVALEEYKLLCDSNGDTSKIETSASIKLTLDAIEFYGVTLLSRINLVNTTMLNIYKNDNGFPLIVKTLTIDASSMSADLQADNVPFDTQANSIPVSGGVNNYYPVEPLPIPEKLIKQCSKYDVSTGEEIK